MVQSHTTKWLNISICRKHPNDPQYTVWCIGNVYDGTIRTLKYEVQQKIVELNGLGVEYRSVQGSIVDKAAEAKSRVSTARLNAAVGGGYVQRIEAFMRLLQEDMEDTNPDDDLDGDICMGLIESYKAAKAESKEPRERAQTLSEDEEKRDECEEANRDFQEIRDRAAEHLRTLKRWKQELDAEIERQKEMALSDSTLFGDHSNDGEKGCFGYVFTELCKLVFNLRVVGATLKHFKEEIKRSTGKKVCCFVV